MLNPNKHAIHGRLKTNGNWELICPAPETIQRKFLFFKWQETRYPEVIREEAVEIAQKEWSSGKYQDVMVIQDNYDEDSWHDYCAVCVWKNGRWVKYAVNTNSPYRWR